MVQCPGAAWVLASACLMQAVILYYQQISLRQFRNRQPAATIQSNVSLKLLPYWGRGSVRKPRPVKLVRRSGCGVLAIDNREQYDGAAPPFMDLGMAIAKRETAAAVVCSGWKVDEIHGRWICRGSQAGVIDAINALVALHEDLRRTRRTAET